MNTTTKLDSLVSQFDTQQEADEYAAWLTKKVEKALQSKTWYTHEEVVARAAQRRAELLVGLKNGN